MAKIHETPYNQWIHVELGPPLAYKGYEFHMYTLIYGDDYGWRCDSKDSDICVLDRDSNTWIQLIHNGDHYDRQSKTPVKVWQGRLRRHCDSPERT